MTPVRAGNMGDTITQELHGRYYETTYRRNKFVASVTGQTTTVALAATYTGLVIYNPISSTVNLVPTKVGIYFGVVPGAAQTFGVMLGYNVGNITTLTTPQTVRNRYIGSSAGQGLAASSIVAASAFTGVIVLGSVGTGGVDTLFPIIPSLYDLEGSVVLPPGALIAVYTSSASGASALSASFSWEEVPV